MSKANLADADLPGAGLTGANLSGANLAGADLTDAVLDGGRLHQATVDSRTQWDAKWALVHAVLNDIEEGPRPASADFSGAEMRNAFLDGADLTGGSAQRRPARGDAAAEHPARRRPARRRPPQRLACYADLTGADLPGTNLREVDLSYVNWAGTQIDARTVIPARIRQLWSIVNEGGVDRELREREPGLGQSGRCRPVGRT
ncbi:MAG: pentapeptide repeat-containing protein [Caldilineaceae bacterium]